MKTLVISYSLTGNNEALAKLVSEKLGAEHTSVLEYRPRNMGTIMLDIMFKRTPKIQPININPEKYDLVLFVGPVWIGHAGSPLRACFRDLGPNIKNYAFVSICGGAEGPNPKLAEDLEKRMGKAPMAIIELAIADLLPAEPKPQRKDTMAYRVTEESVHMLAEKVVSQVAAFAR